MYTEQVSHPFKSGEFHEKMVNEAGGGREEMTVTQGKEKSLRMEENTAWASCGPVSSEKWGPQRIQHFLTASKAGKPSSPVPSDATRTSAFHDLRTGRRAAGRHFLVGAIAYPVTFL